MLKKINISNPTEQQKEQQKAERNNWTELAMPNDLVDAAHQMAAASKHAGGITFTYKARNIITDNDNKDDDGTGKEEPIPIADNS